MGEEKKRRGRQRRRATDRMRQTNLKSGDNAASSLAFPSHVPDLDQVLGANLSPALTLKKKNPLPSFPFSVADPVATSPYSLSPPPASQRFTNQDLFSPVCLHCPGDYWRRRRRQEVMQQLGQTFNYSLYNHIYIHQDDTLNCPR